MFQLGAVKLLTRGRVHALMALAWGITTSAWAAGGYVYEAAGKVSLGPDKGAAHTAVKNEVIPSGTVVTTGDKSYAVLKFEDGQMAAMQANTAFHIKEYRYDPKNTGKSNIVFSKFTGGMRFITGSIGQRNHEAFRLSTPNATIDTRGTEFVVATLNNTLYSRVISGSISMTNEAGMTVFTAGQTILVASRNTLPAAIPAAALPTGIFSQLEVIPTPPVNAAGAAPGTVSGAGAATAGASAVTSAAGMPATALPSGAIPTAPSSTTISITGAGATYTAANTPCDFCTGRTDTVATHTPIAADSADENPVTGDASLFGKHNLTPTGANTGEICAFCHTPQGSESNVKSPPLWNRTALTMSSYRAYSSLGSATVEATGSVSMSCLSCHDGTQAPNIVINTPNNTLNIPSDEIIDIGNTLKNHHPVGMPYAGGGQDQNAPDIPPDPVDAYSKLAGFNQLTSVGNKFIFFNRRGVVSSNATAAFSDVGNFSKAGNFTSAKGGFNKSMHSGTGNGTVWWVETPNSKKGRQKTDLYLFTRTDNIGAIPGDSTINQPYVECATCHDPHSANSTFLRLPGGNARSQVCLTCHNK